MADVFIACSMKEDGEIARKLCAKLKSAGISVWYAEQDIKPGDWIRASIQEAMEQSKVCVFIFSKSSIYSGHFSTEFGYAVKLIREERRRIFILPLAIDAEGKSVLPKKTTQDFVWFDASEPPLETRLNEFAQALARTLHEPKESAS